MRAILFLQVLLWEGGCLVTSVDGDPDRPRTGARYVCSYRATCPDGNVPHGTVVEDVPLGDLATCGPFSEETAPRLVYLLGTSLLARGCSWADMSAPYCEGEGNSKDGIFRPCLYDPDTWEEFP